MGQTMESECTTPTPPRCGSTAEGLLPGCLPPRAAPAPPSGPTLAVRLAQPPPHPRRIIGSTSRRQSRRPWIGATRSPEEAAGSRKLRRRPHGEYVHGDEFHGFDRRHQIRPKTIRDEHDRARASGPPQLGIGQGDRFSANVTLAFGHDRRGKGARKRRVQLTI